MHQLISSSVFLLAFVAMNGVVVNGQVPFPGRCPEVKIMETFDLAAYMGIWYEHSKYPFAFEVGRKCIFARYEVIDNSTISVVNAAINRFTGASSNVTGTGKVIAPAQLAVKFSKNQQENKANYLVLGTDYETYAVVYSCTSLTPMAHSKVLWILARERQPSEVAIAAALKIVNDNQLNKSFLMDTNQENCPKLDANGTVVAPPLEGNESTVLPQVIESA